MNVTTSVIYMISPETTLDILTAEDTHFKKADYIYKLRNKTVQFQRTDEDIESIPDSDWNMIIRFVLKTIPFLYNRFNQHIIELPDIKIMLHTKLPAYLYGNEELPYKGGWCLVSLYKI